MPTCSDIQRVTVVKTMIPGKHQKEQKTLVLSSHILNPLLWTWTCMGKIDQTKLEKLNQYVS